MPKRTAYSKWIAIVAAQYATYASINFVRCEFDWEYSVASLAKASILDQTFVSQSVSRPWRLFLWAPAIIMTISCHPRRYTCLNSIKSKVFLTQMLLSPHTVLIMLHNPNYLPQGLCRLWKHFQQFETRSISWRMDHSCIWYVHCFLCINSIYPLSPSYAYSVPTQPLRRDQWLLISGTRRRKALSFSTCSHSIFRAIVLIFLCFAPFLKFDAH